MADLSPQGEPKRTFGSGRAHLAMYKCTTYIPDMSCEDSKRARHRQRQAAYEARQRAGLRLYERTAYMPDMSGQDSKRARHRQRQAAYEVRFATATEAEQFLMGYRRRHL
jgi:hypothetical protein